MSSVSGWILSISGVCVMSVLVDLILPDGKTNSFIKNMFSYLIILVIIFPLPKIFSKNFSINSIFNYEEIEVQEDFIYQLNRNKLDKLAKQIEQDLKDKEIEGVKVALSANIFTFNMEIEAVFVDLFDLVINENNEHIDIKKEALNSVLKYVSVGKEKVIFNE